MKKIDIHCHVSLFPEYDLPRLNGTKTMSAEEQISVHDKLNVELGVILPIVSPEGIWKNGTNSVAKVLCDQNPGRFSWFCNIDPRMGTNSTTTDFTRVLMFYKELGAKGVGELTANIYADDPKMDNMFYHCARCDMPVLVHISEGPGRGYGIADDLGLPRIEKMLRKYPDLRIIGHSACFWSEISSDNTDETRGGYPEGKVKEGRIAQLMREYGNLYCDLSAGSGSRAMMRDPEYAAKFLTEFSDRIYYGTDVCAVTQTFQYRFDEFLTGLVTDKMITEETYEKIVRKNAAKLLEINE